MSKPKSWHVFKHEYLDRPRNIRTAKLWLENGTIRGKAIKNEHGEVVDVLVDVDHWRASFNQSECDLESEALELLV
jgi:hypothetical protein